MENWKGRIIMIKWNSKEGVCDIVSVESDKQIKLKN
jgi:hypothetical protein